MFDGIISCPVAPGGHFKWPSESPGWTLRLAEVSNCGDVRALCRTRDGWCLALGVNAMSLVRAKYNVISAWRYSQMHLDRWSAWSLVIKKQVWLFFIWNTLKCFINISQISIFWVLCCHLANTTITNWSSKTGGLSIQTSHKRGSIVIWMHGYCVCIFLRWLAHTGVWETSKYDHRKSNRLNKRRT